MKKTGIEELNEKESILNEVFNELEEKTKDKELVDSIRRLKLGIEDLKGIYTFAKHEYKTKGEAPILQGKCDIKANKESIKQIHKQARANVRKPISVFELLNKERSIVSSFVDYCFTQTKDMTPAERKNFVKSEISNLLSLQAKFDKQIKQQNKVIAKKKA